MLALEAVEELKFHKNPQALAILYDLYFARVYNYIRYRCNDQPTVDDLTSQAFERLLEKLPQYAPERGPFEAWLFALVRNLVADHFRSRRLNWIPWESLWREPMGEASPESQLIDRETEAELLVAIQALDKRSRDLLGLKFGARLTNRQIADLVSLNESNVAVIIYRAVAQLRITLQPTGNTHQPDWSSS